VCGMIVGVIRLVAMTMFGVRVLVCQFGITLRILWQPVRTRSPGDCNQRGHDCHGNQPIATTGIRLFDGIGHTATKNSGDPRIELRGGLETGEIDGMNSRSATSPRIRVNNASRRQFKSEARQRQDAGAAVVDECDR
jgi:hypothetical protein